MNSINDASRDQLIANLKDLAAKENELKEKIEALKIES
jgi:outer membrane murein-binding lipoprotein Lpp